MSVATEKPRSKARPWDTSPYARIVDARVDGEELIVLFADHSWATVALDRLLPSVRSRIYWERTTFSPHDIAVPTDDGTVEISWLSIRALTDPAFAAHLDAVGKESAQRSGRQIRRWRQEQRMSLDKLASAAEVDPATLARIEQGDVDVSFSTLRRIVAPLGHTLKDLALAAREDETDSTSEKDR